MINFGNDSFKPLSIALWSQSFRDSPEYINYYFSSRYRNENFLFYKENEQLLGGAHFNPYNFNFLGNEFSSRYLVGVATFPQFKNRGVFKNIFNFALEYFSKNGVDLFFLTPANSEIYSKFNFAISHYLTQYELNFSDIKKQNILHNICEITTENLNLYKAFISNELLNFSSSLKMNHKNFIDTLEETNLENGHIYIIKDKLNQCVGAFTYIPNDNTITVQHLFFKNHDVLSSILGFLSSFSDYYEGIKITADVHSDLEIYFSNFKKIKKTVKPYLMTRVLNAKKIIQCFLENKHNSIKNYLSLDYNFIIELKDKDIFSNNLTLLCNFNKNSLAINSLSDNEFNNYKISENIPIMSLDISTFTSLVFGGISLDNLIKSGSIIITNEKNHELLNLIFYIKKGYIHRDV